MEIVLLIIGIIIGTVVGYLAADRKSAALRAEISGTKKEIELLKLQKEEAEALHKRMNTEVENLSNRIFQSKAEDFTRLNTEHLGNLLRTHILRCKLLVNSDSCCHFLSDILAFLRSQIIGFLTLTQFLFHYSIFLFLCQGRTLVNLRVL